MRGSSCYLRFEPDPEVDKFTHKSKNETKEETTQRLVRLVKTKKNHE
jgi:hypothetical protein